MTAATPPHIVLEPIAREQASVLQNLAELYAHDFSEHVPLDLTASGRFELSLGERWWTSGHYPFFIRCDQKLCGFVLVQTGSQLTGGKDVMDVAEFFVVRGVRRKQVGSRVAHLLFSRFPGKWEIRVRESNPAALAFWSRTIAQSVGNPIASRHVSVRGVSWQVFRFEPKAETEPHEQL